MLRMGKKHSTIAVLISNTTNLSINLRVNRQIRAPEVRVIGPAGENVGVIPLAVALEQAVAAGLDLIEISPSAVPPVAKIADFGKFQYDYNKKQKAAKAHAHETEIKTVQVKIGTGDHDLELKAKKVSEWLAAGDRVKVDLFLPGRTKYMDQNFLKERMGRLLKLITEEYKLAEPIAKSPKGLSTVVERAKR